MFPHAFLIPAAPKTLVKYCAALRASDLRRLPSLFTVASNPSIAMRENATFLVLMGVAATIVVLFLFPYVMDIGHPWVISGVVIFFVLLLIYGRHNPAPRRRPKT